MRGNSEVMIRWNGELPFSIYTARICVYFCEAIHKPMMFQHSFNEKCVGIAQYPQITPDLEKGRPITKFYLYDHIGFQNKANIYTYEGAIYYLSIYIYIYPRAWADFIAEIVCGDKGIFFKLLSTSSMDLPCAWSSSIIPICKILTN